MTAALTRDETAAATSDRLNVDFKNMVVVVVGIWKSKKRYKKVLSIYIKLSLYSIQ